MCESQITQRAARAFVHDVVMGWIIPVELRSRVKLDAMRLVRRAASNNEWWGNVVLF
jgi:hypothetical protein